jgi:hypothetical protein
MEQEQDWADGDPEIAALLEFEPVLRRTRRHDGWTPARQRGFIAGLARLGSVDLAAQGMDGTSSGIWKVRESAGAQEFAESWDGALTLFHRRNPALTRRGGRARPPWCQPRPAPAPPPGRAPEPDGDDPEEEELNEQLWNRYLLKLASERQARLEGRIAEADYYVRQLTFIELVFDLGGCAFEMLSRLRCGGVDLFHLVATPVSTAFERTRRDIWREQGEADRLPPAPLGDYDDECAWGERNYFNGPTDGDYNAWHAARDEKHRMQAEAQAAWEERGRAEAAARRARLEGKDGAAEGTEAAS